ncbi:hypothetical protein TRVA0_001S08856 [Trichomonascus vanleenenianus]|uniref:uncharacterized protein n=1 Tax=Trichomonascus vanleenenianus TaxID=2268995 RepID=UPI003ECB6450
MSSLPGEIWLIILEYLAEYEHSVDSQLWRIRPVCKALACLADSLIWSKVTLNYNRGRSDGEKEPNKFVTLLDAVRKASDAASRNHFDTECDTHSYMLQQIKHNVAATQVKNLHDVIHNIEQALIAIENNNPCELRPALSFWLENRAAGVHEIIKALIFPGHGYAKNDYYGNEISSTNVQRGISIIKRYYHYIKHAKLYIRSSADGNVLALFTAIVNGIAANSRLTTLDVALECLEETPFRTKSIELLKTFTKNPPQRLIFSVGKYVLDTRTGIVEALCVFPYSMKLGPLASFEKQCAVPTVAARLIKLKIKTRLDILQLEQHISPCQELTRLNIRLGKGVGKFKLPIRVKRFRFRTTNRHYMMHNFTMVSNGLKSLTIIDSNISIDALSFPNLESLTILRVKTVCTDMLRPSPMPRLKTLRIEMKDSEDSNICLLKLLRPSKELIVYHMPKELHANLLLSRCLPPLVRIHLQFYKLGADKTYFLQSLLAQPTVSWVQLVCQYSNHRPSPRMPFIPPEYRILVGHVTHKGRVTDIHTLRRQFINLRIPKVSDRIKRAFAPCRQRSD